MLPSNEKVLESKKFFQSTEKVFLSLKKIAQPQIEETDW